MALSDIEGLREACRVTLDAMNGNAASRQWGEDLKSFLEYVRNSNMETRASVEFQQRVWDDNPVSAVGQGAISVDAAIADPEFRKWLAEKSLTALPQSLDERAVLLQELFNELTDRVSRYTNRSPLLKVYRVLAAFYPTDFTTITHGRRLRQLHQAMGLVRGALPVARHIQILSRLSEALGPIATDVASVVERMRLPWHLYERFVAGVAEDTTETPEEGGTGLGKLKPLPAERRRRGLTAISGGVANLLNILEFSRDGVSREDLISHIRSLNPTIKEITAKIAVNVLTAEYNVIHWTGSRFELTSRGEAFLESGDPDELVDWILTRILAADHVLVWLRDRGEISQAELLKLAQAVNPGWTTNFAPSVLLTCLRQLRLIEPKNGKWHLTETGRAWAARIDWTPQVLIREAAEILPVPGDKADETPDRAKIVAELPPLADIQKSVSAAGAFSNSLIARLHAGLWANARRHFAVLTGLSGAGKTMLGRAYARAIAGADGVERVLVLPVQPGWYDPAPLLGYINPLQPDAYVRTSFLEFLLRASEEPDHPYTVILDEMNLSRPEQYLAPILSAMETGEAVMLHQEGEQLDGVPGAILYPKNLVIIGTVNMDETTHGLSDKVLDRAFTIEFWDIDMSQYPWWGSRDLPESAERQARQLLDALMISLRPARLHFGWRTVDDVLDYLVVATQHGAPEDVAAILDSVVYAKVIPKLRGDDSPRFRDALKACRQVLADHGLDECVRKVEELQVDLIATGSARFWR
jgi:hypothetical protein